MEYNDVLLAVKSLKTKNCEGHDRLPQRILIDGIEILINPLVELFQKIYEQRKLPQQWLFPKQHLSLKRAHPKTSKTTGQFQICVR